MILILSRTTDSSTNDVIDWLDYYGEKFIRLNSNSNRLLKLSISCGAENDENAYIEFDNSKIILSDISAYWYRRGGIPSYPVNPRTIFDIFKDPGIISQLVNNLNEEINTLVEFLHYYIENKEDVVKLNSAFNASVNKLKVLYLAQKVGLQIPHTFVTTIANEAENFSNKNKNNIITKSMGDGVLSQSKSTRYFNYTEKISLENISKTEHFFPSKFQENIKKELEIRSFFLNGNFYSMAIFSQSNTTTQTDFRKYDYEKPSRKVPYCLPNGVEEKLRRLLNELELNSCSIDLILSEDNQYYFLEVNPVGQFGMTSGPCNYYLEKKIASYLSKKTNYGIHQE